MMPTPLKALLTRRDFLRLLLSTGGAISPYRLPGTQLPARQGIGA